MTFINEYISDEDREKFDIDEIDKRFIVGGVYAGDWTINRDSNIYLRVVSRGREEMSHQSKWTLYWKGVLIELELDNISTSGRAGGDRHGHKLLRRINIPDQLEAKYEEIIEDLREALTVYKDGGVFSTAKKYSLTLDVMEEK